MDREQLGLNYSAIMYRGPTTPDKFNSIINREGAYDVLVTSGGNPDYMDRDQIGFRHKKLHLDAAFQSDRRVYEFAGFREGGLMTVLGSISGKNDKEGVRRFVSKVIGQLYQEIVEEGVPDMELQSVITRRLTSYKPQIPLETTGFSEN